MKQKEQLANENEQLDKLIQFISTSDEGCKMISEKEVRYGGSYSRRTFTGILWFEINDYVARIVIQLDLSYNIIK
jgi:hypothetical protein